MSKHFYGVGNYSLHIDRYRHSQETGSYTFAEQSPDIHHSSSQKEREVLPEIVEGNGNYTPRCNNPRGGQDNSKKFTQPKRVASFSSPLFSLPASYNQEPYGEVVYIPEETLKLLQSRNGCRLKGKWCNRCGLSWRCRT